MWKLPACALAVLAALPGPAGALELKNPHPSYGLLSVPRANNKFLPGDKLVLLFDIDELKVNAKTGVAHLQQSMEITDSKGNLIFSQKPQAIEVPLFGARQMPGVIMATMAFGQKPGQYKVRVTVEDKLAKAKKSLDYDFVLLKQAFGIVQPFTPAVAFLHQDFIVSCAVAGMSRDPKTKMPDVEISVRMLKDGKPVVPAAITNNVRDFHVAGTDFDLTRMTVIPISMPVVLSQPGTFAIELRATDRLAKETATLTLPLTVVDPTPYLKAAKTKRTAD